jgi:hypothetical protein
LSISKFLIVFIIPIVILGLGIWGAASLNVKSGDVRVAGAQISAVDVEITVNRCYMDEVQGARTLVVELEARNAGSKDTDIYPFLFQAILTVQDKPVSPGAPQNTFSPIYYQSICDAAPYSTTRLPPDSIRSLTLHFYGATMPRGDEWDDHYLSLEYYDMKTHLLLSKPLNPEGG